MGTKKDRERIQEERIKKVKSFLYSAGLRSRHTSREYPDDADILYPKYNTAVFIRDCFEHGHDCGESVLPEINRELWKEKVRVARNRDGAIYRRTIEKGWNAIVLWGCAIGNQENMWELYETIIANEGNSPKTDEVIEIGRHKVS